MRAVVLVGGEGTRLRPLTSRVPKPLLPIAGQPIVERQLDWLGEHGVDDVVLSLGYLPDAFRAHFPDDDYQGMRLRYAVEEVPLGTAGGIGFAAETAGIHDRFVVCNGDVLTTLDLGALIRFHDERRADATIHLTRVDDPSEFGVVPTREDGSVLAFVEKPPRASAPADWINAGTYVLEPSVLDRIPAGVMVSIERETFPGVLDDQGRLFALGTDDYWLDVGTPDKYLQAHTDVVQGKLGVPPVDGAEEVGPGVWAQPSAAVAPDALVRGPVLLCADSVVEAGASVENATLCCGSVVEREAVVHDAVLLEWARVQSGARVEHSIVGPAASVGSGAGVLDGSIVGPGAQVEAGASLDAARVELPAAAG